MPAGAGRGGGGRHAVSGPAPRPAAQAGTDGGGGRSARHVTVGPHALHGGSPHRSSTEAIAPPPAQGP